MSTVFPTDPRLNTLFDIGLDKWPQLRLWGPAISEDQALDIVFRTDSMLNGEDIGYFWSGGNNKKWNEYVRFCLGYDKIQKFLEEYEKDDAKVALRWRLGAMIQNWMAERLHAVTTEYVSNTWTSCSFIYGPHGWCNPDGTIMYMDNIGKWPSVQEVLRDFQTIAKAWPFLKLKATLMSGEADTENLEPKVSFIMENGTVGMTLDHPKENLGVHHRWSREGHPTVLKNRFRPMGGFDREIGMTEAAIHKWAKVTRPLVEQVLKEAVTWTVP